MMNNLKLANPKMMDVAVPANMRVGLHQEEIAKQGWAVTAGQICEPETMQNAVLVDLREQAERERHGVIRNSIHVPYPALQGSIGVGGLLYELSKAGGKKLIFYCAFGERSAMAVQAAQDAGVKTVRHLQGGIAAWKAAGGEVEWPSSSHVSGAAH
jgi:rhodanese-related sulfurtransferase